MDGRKQGIGRCGRAFGPLALAILIWPLGGQANIPRIPFQALPRDAPPELPVVVRWHAARDGEAEQRTIELAQVPEGTRRIPVRPAPLDH